MISFKPFCNDVPMTSSIASHRGIRQHLPASIKLIAVSKQVSVAAMREAYAAEFGILAKVASKQPANRVNARFKILPGTLLEVCKATKRKKALELFQWITH